MTDEDFKNVRTIGGPKNAGLSDTECKEYTRWLARERTASSPEYKEAQRVRKAAERAARESKDPTYKERLLERARKADKKPERRAKKLARARERYDTDPEYRTKQVLHRRAERQDPILGQRILENDRKRYPKRREVLLKRSKEHSKDPKHREARLARNLLRNYGITIAQRDALFERQEKVCRLCKTDVPGGKGWCVDHIKGTKIVRGILCFRCNLWIGLADHNPVTIRAGADYVEEWAKIAEESNGK